MKARPTGSVLIMALALSCSCAVRAQPPQSASAPPSLPAPAPSAAWRPDDRVTLSADVATLTGTDGGGGGDAAYLQQLSPDLLVGAGADYQRLANSYWTFASLNTSFSHALTTHSRWDLHADVHEGGGENYGLHGAPNQTFTYSIAGAGAGLALPGGVAADLEDRYFDVDGTTGYLPKLTLARSWGTHWLTTAAYASSYSGNLDTNYGLLRLDYYGRGYGALGGISVGRVSPAVVDIAGVLRAQARHLTEGFLGVSKTIERVDLSLLGDDIDLLGIRHLTVTLQCTIHLR